MARAERVASLPLLVYWLTRDCCYQLIPIRCQAIGSPEGCVRPTVPWTSWEKQGALGSAMQAAGFVGCLRVHLGLAVQWRGSEGRCGSPGCL